MKPETPLPTPRKRLGPPLLKELRAQAKFDKLKEKPETTQGELADQKNFTRLTSQWTERVESHILKTRKGVGASPKRGEACQ